MSMAKLFCELKWKDKIFRIWVAEEENVWVPDCLGSSKPELSSEDKEVPVMVNSGREEEKSGDEGIDVLGSNTLGKNKQSFFDKVDSAFNELWAVESSFCSFGSGGIGVSGNNNQNNLKDGGPNTFKRRKGKNGSVLVGSPLDSRPKKRVRAQMEKEDLFGMDELVQNGPYPFQNRSAMEIQESGKKEFVDLDASLDLNRRAASSHDLHDVNDTPERAVETQIDEASSGVRSAEFS
ncbi:hypothetical protein Hanom_Chr13g01197351 [Helianthus anomalus]